MSKQFISIKELAVALNLSTSTVSRAFRNKEDINPATKKLILEKAKELGYYPNIYASNLRNAKSKTIAVIMPELANNFFSLAVKGIERVAQSNGYHTLIYVTDSLYEKEVEIIEDLYNGRVEGIIMSVSGEGNDHKYINKLKSKNIPLVFFDRVYDDIDFPKVTTDDYESCFKATEYLLKNNCRFLAFLVINKNVSIGKERMKGFSDACSKYGLPKENSLIIDCSNDFEESYSRIKQLLGTKKINAVIASVERLAIAAYTVCLNENIKIPDDLKLISYSNLSIADLLHPPLSTITQPAENLGSNAAEILFDMLNGREPANKNVILKSDIIHRISTEFFL